MADVKDMSVVEILDKHIDQKGLIKDLVVKYLADKFAQLEADLDSGSFDPIPGTQIDNMALKQLFAIIKKTLEL